jgi:predicted phosphodiesterase
LKIILTSDIHYGNLCELEGNGEFTVAEHKKFAALIHAEKPDVLIVTGDCGETCIDEMNLFRFFETYKNPHGTSICIPGNHDLWLHPDDKGTHWEKYDRFFKQAERNGWIALRDDIWQKDGIVVAGSMGWYDFSSADPVYSLTPEDWDRWHPWSDYRAMKMKSAVEVAKKRIAEFKTSLSKIPPVDQRKALIVISHFPAFSRLMAIGEFPSPDVGAAFMGNYEMGKMVAEVDPQLFFCGHTHRRKEFKLGEIICINNGSGYGLGSKKFDTFEF